MCGLNFPGINWEYHTARTNRSRQLLKDIEGNFLVQVLRETTREGALLDFLFVNGEGLMAEVVICGSLGHSDHQVLGFQVVVVRKNCHQNFNSGRADFGLLEEPVHKVESAFEGIGVYECWALLRAIS